MASNSNDDGIRQIVYPYYDVMGDNISSQYSFGPYWQEWELFNANFRCFKSVVFEGQKLKFSDLHKGAMLNLKEDLDINDKQLKLVYASRQYETKSGAKDTIIKHQYGEASISECKYFVLNAPNAEAGDAWCGLETCPPLDPPPREVHQYKLRKGPKLTSDTFKEEREKAAQSNDMFMLFTQLHFAGEPSDLPRNSGLVFFSNFSTYYGPYAGRAFFVANTPPPDPNTASRFHLESVNGIGDSRSTLLINHREKDGHFTSLEDCHKRTGIPVVILKRLNWEINTTK